MINNYKKKTLDIEPTLDIALNLIVNGFLYMQIQLSLSGWLEYVGVRWRNPLMEVQDLFHPFCDLFKAYTSTW